MKHDHQPMKSQNENKSHSGVKVPVDRAGSPEFNYPNLFQVASMRIPYIPIFQSDGAVDSPEFQWDEVVIDVLPEAFRLPREFSSNPVSPRFEKLLKAGHKVDHHGKCRFVGYHAEFTPPGSEGRLTITLAETDYFAYLRSGECLDLKLPKDAKRTFREKYAPSIHVDRDYSNWKLTNICGVGIFLLTSDQKIIIAKHSRDVAVFPDVLSYSASGTMDWNRIDPPFTGHPATNNHWRRFLNPFAQIQRETHEELAHRIDAEHTRLFGLGIDAKKLYFQFSFFERTSLTSKEIINRASSARDYFKEITALRAIDLNLNSLVRVAGEPNWEPAAKAALLSLCAREFGTEAVERAIDPEFVAARWKRKMHDEWNKRAARKGIAAVMSSRYSEHEMAEQSRKYVDAVIAFLGKDIAGKDVVEFGSGIGRLTERMLPSAGRVTCVEFCEPMIRACKARLAGTVGFKEKVSFVRSFGQDYQPSARHDIALSSLVMVHNVGDEEFERLVGAMANAGDVIFLFEHVDAPHTPHPHTRIRSEKELLGAFPDFMVERRGRHTLFSDRLVFLKLKRGSPRKSGPRRGVTRAPKSAKPSQIPPPPVKKEPLPEPLFDVFLSHNSKDKALIRRLSKELKARGLRVWLDESELIPGQPWQHGLERIIRTARSAAVIVGREGLGPWEVPEMGACLSQFVGRGLPVIPVLLPEAPEKPRLPLFLEAFTWVDLRRGITKKGIDRLVWGITGSKP